MWYLSLVLAPLDWATTLLEWQVAILATEFAKGDSGMRTCRDVRVRKCTYVAGFNGILPKTNIAPKEKFPKRYHTNHYSFQGRCLF